MALFLLIQVMFVKVALGDIHLRFTWQAWYLVTSTSTLRGRRGTWGHRPSLCVAGVALGAAQLTHTCSPTTCPQRHFDTPLCHTPSFTHHFVTPSLSQTTFTRTHTHHLSYTTLSHTIFDTPLCETPSFTHHLSHTIFVTPLCHTPSFTHHLSHTIFVTPLCHTPSLTHNLLHTIFHRQLCHTPSFTHHFVTHHH